MLQVKQIVNRVFSSNTFILSDDEFKTCFLVDVGDVDKVLDILPEGAIIKGISIIPKSTNSGRLKENISIFDFQLTSSEMSVIDSLDKGKFLNYDPYATFHPHNLYFGRVPKKYRSWKGFINNI